MLVLRDYIHDVRIVCLDDVIVDDEFVLVHFYRRLSPVIVFLDQVDDVRRYLQRVLGVKIVGVLLSLGLGVDPRLVPRQRVPKFLRCVQRDEPVVRHLGGLDIFVLPRAPDRDDVGVAA